jgi:hypothetical protein
MQKKKTFDKIQHHFMKKSSKKTRNRRNVLKHYKGYYDKPISNNILNGEKLKPFPLKSGMRQARMPTFPIPMQHSPRIPSQSNMARRINKRNTNR